MQIRPERQCDLSDSPRIGERWKETALSRSKPAESTYFGHAATSISNFVLGLPCTSLAPGTRFCCFFAQGLCLSISTLRLNLSRAILGRGSNKPERRHRGPPLLLWTAGYRLIKPMSSHAIRARMTPKHSRQLE